MPTERTILVYKFSELSDEAKEKALNEYINDYEYEWDDYDFWSERLTELGFEDPRIEWSGFATQGSGASFIADIDTMKLASTLIYCCTNYEEAQAIDDAVELIYNLGIKRTNTHYSHENTCTFDMEMEEVDDDLSEAIAMKVSDVFLTKAEDLRVALCHKIYASIQEDYEYQTSMEAFEETCECNEWEFNENGELI